MLATAHGVTPPLTLSTTTSTTTVAQRVHGNHAQGFAELVLERDQEETGSGNQNDGADDLYTLPEILSAVRRACLSRAAVPVLCGSSLRGIGVEPLLDSVSTFLPSPLDRPRPTGVVREASAPLRGGGGVGGGGGGGKKRRRGESAVAGGGDAAAAEGVVDVDPLQDDLVAFVFKVGRGRKRQQPCCLGVGGRCCGGAGALLERVACVGGEMIGARRPQCSVKLRLEWRFSCVFVPARQNVGRAVPPSWHASLRSILKLLETVESRPLFSRFGRLPLLLRVNLIHRAL